MSVETILEREREPDEVHELEQLQGRVKSGRQGDGGVSARRSTDDIIGKDAPNS